MEAIIYLEQPLDLTRTMYCENCGNPISIFSDYKCNKCKTKHIFKLKDYEFVKKQKKSFTKTSKRS